jgi:hypothetical protein
MSKPADEFIVNPRSTAQDAISTEDIGPAPTHRGVAHISPERLLVGDLIILFRLLDRAEARTFGISGEGSTLLTLILIASFARAVRRVFAAPRKQVRKARSSPTFVGDTMIATAALKETVDSIAGHPSRDKSFAAGLIAFALLTHSFRPAVAGSLGALRKAGPAVITKAFRLRAQFAARGRSGRSGG